MGEIETIRAGGNLNCFCKNLATIGHKNVSAVFFDDIEYLGIEPASELGIIISRVFQQVLGKALIIYNLTLGTDESTERLFGIATLRDVRLNFGYIVIIHKLEVGIVSRDLGKSFF